MKINFYPTLNKTIFIALNIASASVIEVLFMHTRMLLYFKHVYFREIQRVIYSMLNSLETDIAYLHSKLKDIFSN